MSSLHEALRTHLLADTNLSALIDERFFYVVVPQKIPRGDQRMPCVVFNRNSVERSVRYCGTDGLVRAGVSLDCYALRYIEARAVANAVRQSIIDYRGTLGGLLQVQAVSLVNEIDLVDIEPGLFRVSQSWDFWHIEEE